MLIVVKPQSGRIPRIKSAKERNMAWKAASIAGAKRRAAKASAPKPSKRRR